MDGFLKPNGPTIGKIGSLLGGAEPQPQGAEKPSDPWEVKVGGRDPGDPNTLKPPAWWQAIGDGNGDSEDPEPFPGQPHLPSPVPPGGEPVPPAGLGVNNFVEHRPTQEQMDQYQAEYRKWVQDNWDAIQKNQELKRQGLPTIPLPPPPRDPRDGIPGVFYAVDPAGAKSSPAGKPDPFPNHTINQEGIDASQAYAEMLVRDSDPSQTARMLKRAIDDYGDQGRGDVADLLARFQKIDGGKAETLRRELHKATGEMLPYRLAPLGEGFREPTEEEKIAAAPKTPFGSPQGADRWAAGNMAEVLLGRGDYADAITHFLGEVGRNRAETMPYLAAVHEIMGDKNPAQAAKFATQMQRAGLAAEAEAGAEAEKKPEPVPPSAPAPTPAPAPEPEPQPQPPAPPQPAPAPRPEPTLQPNQTAEPPAKGSEEPTLPSPTNKPIDPQALYAQLGYQHDGSGDYGNAIKHPLDAIKANRAADAATAAAQSEYGKTNPALGNGEGDAFRHALWSYKMAKEIGSGAARGFGDAHERDGQPDGERLMDLYNNAIGRELAADPRNKDRPDEEVIREAIKAGKLQTRPFNIPGPMGGGLTYPPRR